MEKLKFVKGESVKVCQAKFKDELLKQGWKLDGDEPKQADFSKLKVEELKALLIENGAEAGSLEGLKKAELLALIEA